MVAYQVGAALLGEGAGAHIADSLLISLEIAAFHGIGAAAGREAPSESVSLMILVLVAFWVKVPVP